MTEDSPMKKICPAWGTTEHESQACKEKCKAYQSCKAVYKIRTEPEVYIREQKTIGGIRQ